MAPPLEALLRLLARESEALSRGLSGEPVAPRVGPSVVRARLARYDFQQPLPLLQVASDAAGMLRRWTPRGGHPRRFGMFQGDVDEASVLGDALAALFDPQLAAWESAPAAVELEARVLASLAEKLGVEGRGATFTTGGAESNLTALVLALSRAVTGYVTHGLAGVRPTVYLSDEGHPSVVKAAVVAGLGRDAVRRVRCEPRTWAMDLGALEVLYQRDVADGRRPSLVVATAGSTGAGAVDPLGELSAWCEVRGLWLHVDAAWGGLAALAPSLAPCLRGIERADSVSWDAHKTLGVALGAGMFFCRHPGLAREVLATAADYMPGLTEGRAAPWAETLQWSRRFTGLKVFLALASRGYDGYEARVERLCALAARLREGLSREGFQVLNETPLPLVGFTHPSLGSDRRRARALVDALGRAQVAWLTETTLGGTTPALRACLTSERTRAEDVDALVVGLARSLGS